MFEEEDFSETGLNTMDRRPILGGRGQDDDGSDAGDLAELNDYTDNKEALSTWI